MLTYTDTPLQPELRANSASERWSNDLRAALFLQTLQREDLRCVRSVEFPRVSGLLGDVAAIGEVLLRWRVAEDEDALVRTEQDGTPVLALLVGNRGMAEVIVAAAEQADADAASARLAGILRDPPPPDDRVPVRFWSRGGNGPEWRTRSLPAITWPQVEGNYPVELRARLAALMDVREPSGGSLVLWHGPPGTGKTHALRALSAAWRPWASTHYVTDPEALLSGTDYLMEVATDAPSDKRWRVIVLEDAGELIAAGARNVVGQGLSRVLNLSDGLLGQGVRCLLVITTNEPIGRLHPAVGRPGRCLSQLEFGAFTAQEATAWLALRGVERAVRAPATLAELFAIAGGRTHEAQSPPECFGFARAITRG